MNISTAFTEDHAVSPKLYEPSREKTNIVDSAESIDPDQQKHAAQANPDSHFSPPDDFLFQESLLYTSIHLRRNVSARISHNVSFLLCGSTDYTISE